MTSWCHLDLRSSFAVITSTLLSYKFSAYRLSDSYIGCLVILLSKSTVFICHLLKCSLVFPKDLSFRHIYLFITVLCNSIKHPKYILFADTIKIAHSISSATDSTLPQSDIDSIHGRCAADLILAKLKSAIQC
jgi:hypothetical protein